MNKFHQQIREFRRKNLARLVEEKGGGQTGVKLVAELAHCNYEYLNQILRETVRHEGAKPRAMADGMAARIEAALGKPEGWMDRDHDASTGWRAVLDGVDDRHGPRLAALAVQLREGLISEAEFDAAALLLTRPRHPLSLPAPVADDRQD